MSKIGYIRVWEYYLLHNEEVDIKSYANTFI